jgi:hypothetical protein
MYRPTRIVLAATAALAGLLLTGATGCARSATPPATGGSPPPIIDPGVETIGGPVDPATGDGDGSGETTDGGGGSNGGGSEGGGSEGGEGTGEGPDHGYEPVPPAAKDCLGYDPDNLLVKSAGGSGWAIAEGTKTIWLFDTKTDAEDMLTIAERYTRRCYIGRSNQRPDRYRFIFTYFEVPSGAPAGMAPANIDCKPYHAKELRVSSGGAAGWYLKDDTHVVALLDSAADAERARIVALPHESLCRIGVGNNRPDPYRYILEYWM